MNGIIMGGGGAVVSTTDGGQTWHWVSRDGTHADIPGTSIYDFVRPSSDGKLVAVGSNGLTLTSDNGGANWAHSKTEADVFTWLNGIAIADSGKGVMVGGKGSVLLTNDFGKTWRPTKINRHRKHETPQTRLPCILLTRKRRQAWLMM